MSGLITGIAAVHYYYMRDHYMATGENPTALRYIDWTLTGLALVSTLTHWGLQHGMLSSLATSGGASSLRILQRSESVFQVLTSHVT